MLQRRACCRSCFVSCPTSPPAPAAREVHQRHFLQALEGIQPQLTAAQLEEACQWAAAP